MARLTSALLAFSLLFPVWAAAQVPLAIEGCEGLDPASLAAGLEVELADAAEALAGPPVPHVTLTCTAGLVRIEIADPLTDKRVEREVAEPSTDRARVLTLAVAQLFLTSWLELLLAPAEGPAAEAAEDLARSAVERASEPEAASGPTADAGPAADTVPSSGSITGELALEAGAHWRLEGENLATAAGALHGQVVVNGLVIVGLHVGAAWGRAFRARGLVDVGLAGGGLHAGLRTPPLGPFFVDGALRVGVEVLWLDGRAYRPDEVMSGTTIALVADAWLEVAPSLRAGPVTLALPLSFGGVVFAPEAQISGEPSVVTGGPTLGAAVRVSLVLE